MSLNPIDFETEIPEIAGGPRQKKASPNATPSMPLKNKSGFFAVANLEGWLSEYEKLALSNPPTDDVVADFAKKVNFAPVPISLQGRLVVTTIAL